MIKNRKPAISRMIAALVIILAAVACKREYLPLPDENAGMLPDERKLALKNDSVFIKNTVKYIHALEFALARREAQQVQTSGKRDSLKQQIDVMENFADSHMLFILDSQGRKKYIYGRERAQQFLEKGYLDDSSEGTRADLYRDTPDDMVSIFNFHAFPGLKSVSMSCGRLDYLNLSGMPNLSEVLLKKARNGMTVDMSEVKSTRYVLYLDSTSNIRLKVHPQADVGLVTSNSYLKSLSDMDINNLEILALRKNSRFVNNKLFKVDNPKLRDMTVYFGGESKMGEDGIIYRAPEFDREFVESVSRHCPNLKMMTLVFMNHASLRNADFSRLHLPELFHMYISIGEDTNIDFSTSVLSESVKLDMSNCPKLKELHIYTGAHTKELDLSALSSKANPVLKNISINQNVKKLFLPRNSNEIALKLKVLRTEEIVIPEEAYHKHSIQFLDFFDPFDASTYDDGLKLDWDYLKRRLKSVSGYYNAIPPSEYSPYSNTEEIYFSSTALDFSGPQWNGFKGLIHVKMEFSDQANYGINYLDFGRLKKENFGNRIIRVKPGCIVKNQPTGIVILEE